MCVRVYLHACVCHPSNYRFDFHRKSNVPSLNHQGSEKIVLTIQATVFSYNETSLKIRGVKRRFKPTYVSLEIFR